MNTQKTINEFTGDENSLLWWISERLCTQPTSAELLNPMIQKPELRLLYEEAEEERREALQNLYEEIVCHHSETLLKEDWDVTIEDTVEIIERESFFRGLLLGIRLQKECEGI